MTENINEKMKKSIENLNSQLSALRSNRANPAMLNGITVDYYGSQVPLLQVSAITVPENMVLIVNVFDQNAVKNVEKAIQSSSLGITPNTDGSTIRINLPELTEERRKDLIKVIRKKGEDAKVAIRNIRRDALDEIKEQEKEKLINEDESKKESQNIQSTTDDMNRKIDSIITDKEKEILKI
jgi:ribosome recycling factor